MRGAITVTSVAERSTASSFSSATLPPPTISTRRSCSFRKIGNRTAGFGSTAGSRFKFMRRPPRRRIAQCRLLLSAREPGAQFLLGLTREEPPQAFAGRSLHQILSQQPFDRFRRVIGRAAKPHRPLKG